MRNIALNLIAKSTAARSIRDTAVANDELTQSLKDQQKELKRLKSTEKSANTYQKQINLLEKQRLKLDSARHSQKKLTEEISKSGAPTFAMLNAQRKAQIQVNGLTSSLKAQENKVKRLRRSLRESGVDTRHMAREQGRLSDEIDRSTRAIGRQSSLIKKTRNGASPLSLGAGLAAGAAPAAFAVNSVKKSIRNEANFADVEKVLGSMSAADIDYLRKQTTRQSNISATDMSALLAAGGAAGISNRDELMAFALQANKMGTAFDMESGDAGKTMNTLKAALGLTQQQAFVLAGTANYLSDTMNAKAADITRVMARQGASAKMAGFSVNDTAALAGTLLAGGDTEETAATAIKNISGRLTLGSAASGTQREAMAAIGLDAEYVAMRMQEDATGTLLEVMSAIRNAPQSEQVALISQIIGEEAKGAFSKLISNEQAFTKALGTASASDATKVGSIEAEYAKKISTTQGKLDTLAVSVDNLSSSIGDGFKPAVDAVVPKLTDMANNLTDITKDSKTAVASLVVLSTGLAALIGARKGGDAINRLLGKESKTKKGGFKFGKLSKAAKAVPVIGAGLGALSLGRSLLSGDANALGGAAGSLGGSALGGALGTLLFPGVGTAAGAVIGGMLGEYLGKQGQRLYTQGVDSPQAAAQKLAANNVSQNVTNHITVNAQGDATALQQAVTDAVNAAMGKSMADMSDNDRFTLLRGA